MLVGTVVVKPNCVTTNPLTDEVIKHGLFKYRIEGVDNSTYFYGRLLTNSFDAMAFEAGTDLEFDLLEDERRFDLGLTSIKVDRAMEKLDNGKLKKGNVNIDFFCKLGALMRYAKQMCRKEYAEGYTGLRSASGDFTTEVCTKYIIPFPNGYKRIAEDGTEVEVLGSVSLKLGELMAMHIETDEFKIDFDEDAGCEITRFEPIKNLQPTGFKFATEYLGFPIDWEKGKVAANTDGMYTCLEDIIKNNPDREFSWLLGKNYQIVDDSMLDSVVDMFMSLPDDEYIYYDTETTGLNITFKSRIGQADQCVGIILSYKDGESYFFPMQMKSIPNLCGGDHFFFMEHYMRKILESKKLVAHNMSFDWKVSYIYDINANIVQDTMALFNVTLGAEKENFPSALKKLTRLLLKRDSLELSDLVESDKWGENDIRFWDLPPELVRLYACADTDNTRGLMHYAIQNDLLHKYNATKVYEIEVAFSLAVAYQEFYGHKIDTENLATLKVELDKGLKENYDAMTAIVGHDFNPNSSKQLVNIMYKELGIPEQTSRKSGNLTTDKETLKALSSMEDLDGNVKYPFVRYLLQYREYEGIRKIVDKFPVLCTEDGYLFSEVQQYGTTTGRVSIKSPNYQSYNDPVKKNIVPRPGYYMTDTDYSSVEYRVLGNMAGNEMIKQGFVDPDFDYHAYQAARMYNVSYANVTSKLRKAAKGINFGLPYGMGDESLGARVFGEASVQNTQKAAALRKKYFEGQEDIKEFFDNARDSGVANNYTETYFGRRRYYHRNKFSIAAIRRQAGNAVIQGSAADIYKLAVGRLFQRICREGWLGKVLLTGFIHDEVLCEVHNSIDPMIWLKVLREEFEVKIAGWCPLYMGFGFGMSWYEAKKTELPIQLQWELVEKYGETGYPKWHGDGYELCAEIPEILRDFSVRHIMNCLTDEEQQGKEIKVATNKAMLEVLAEDAKAYNKLFADMIENNEIEVVDIEGQPCAELTEEQLTACREALAKDYVSDVVFVKDNMVLTKLPKLTETQEAIDYYCKLHNLDRSTVNVLNIEEQTASAEAPQVTGNLEIDYDDESDSVDTKRYEMDRAVTCFGVYRDTDESKVYFRVVPPQYMQFIQERCNHEGKGYRVYFRDEASRMIYETPAFITSENISVVADMYLHSYFPNNPA